MTLFWTEERTNYALRRWGEGASATVIAGDLGTTKNAVVGIVHRRGGGIAHPRPRREVGPPAPVALAAVVGGPLAMAELTEVTCRWPVDPAGKPDDGTSEKYLFCGARAEPGSSYCAEHREKSTRRGA